MDYLQLIDTNTTGMRCDVTPLFADATAFARLVADLAAPFADTAVDAVAAIDALGFILGSAIARHLHTGLVPVRKGGKLPAAVYRRTFVDYSGQEKALEIRRDVLKSGDRVLVVDEWIETGAQVAAAISLVEEAGAEVVGIATINIDDNPLPAQLRTAYRCHVLWVDMVPVGQR